MIEWKAFLPTRPLAACRREGGARGGFLLLVSTAACVLLLAGCGFHPVGSTGTLPPAMKVTYVRSGEPYGHLENLLRRAIVARGLKVTQNRDEASAELDILDTQLKRRVLAVNSRGQPLEYDLHYTVRFELVDASGKTLLRPRSIDLDRHLAYNVNIELGSTRRQQQLERDMQREATRLIMMRLEAVRGQAGAK